MPFPRPTITLSRQMGAAFLVAITLWTLDCIGSIDLLDDAVYDTCLQVLSISATEESRVALVYVDHETQRDASALSEVVSLIGEARPEGIALTFVPPTELREALTAADPRVVFPTDCLVDPADLGQWALAERDGGDDPCVLAVPRGHDGIHRWQTSHVQVQDRNVATLEARVSEQVRPTSDIPDRFRILFLGGPGSLPFVEANRLANDPVTLELLRDRVVLIGSVPASPHMTVAGPLARGDERMSALELHGHATNTLLRGRQTTDLLVSWRLPLMLGITLILVVWHERRTVRGGPCLLVALCIFTVLLAVVTLSWANLWIRPASLLLLQLGCCLMLWLRRSAALHREVRSFGVNLVGCARRHAWPVRFAASTNPWDHVAEMIDQLLSPNRLVLMRSTPGDVYIREISAVGCTFKDIMERRRDYRREPYSTALEQGRPIPIHEVRCLLNPVEGESQYLTPLIFRGELMGFCVVAAKPLAGPAGERFLDDLGKIAEQAAEMVHRHAELEQANRCSVRRSDTPATSVDGILAEMSAAVRQLMGRIMRLEDIFGAATVPSFVFDLYGNVLIVNDPMSELLDAEQVRSIRSTSLPLLAETAGVDIETVRGWVRRIATGRSAETHPVSLPTSGQTYLLTLTPVSAPAVGQFVDDVYPFHLVGVRADLRATIPWSALDALGGEPADDSPVHASVGGN